MNLLERLHATLDSGARAPGVRRLVEASCRKEFLQNRDANLFFGVYETFTDAHSAACRDGRAGYDNQASAEMYLAHMRADAHDYPAMFWLDKSFHAGWRRVLDVGGSVGIKYHAFRRVLPLPEDVAWTVAEVPAVAARGRDLAEAQGTTALRFVDAIADGEGAQVLYASGSLQYLPHTLGHWLAPWAARPRRLVINLTPIHPAEAYFTVNSIGTAFCAYRVQTQAALVRELAGLGYVLRDTWANRGKALRLPLHPDLSLDHYRGFCFDLGR